jgi:signal transduction histidine kinase/sugar lactone lactonase YvrE
MVLCIYEDKQGNIWFSTRKGVSCFNGKTFTTYTTAQGLAVNLIYNIAEDKEGNLWFSTFGGGISMLSNNRKAIHTYTVEQGIYGNANVHEIIIDKKQNKWLSNDAGGVTKFDGKTFTTYTDKQGLRASGSLAAFEDTHGNLWFGTNEGLARYDGTSFKYFNEGLPDKDISDIKEDLEGNIWTGGRMGVSRMELKELNNSKSIGRIIRSDTNLSNNDLTKNVKASFVNYNFKNGYPVRDVTYTNSMFFDRENSLWIATSNKFIRFQYSKLHKNVNAPTAFVKQVKLNNESIAWNDLSKDEEKPDSSIIPAKVVEETFLYGQQLDSNQRSEIRKKFASIQFDSITPYYSVPQSLVLPYKYNDVTFEFSAIETTRPDFLNFQYILEGYSNNWSPVTNERSASFGNIHEGTYTFKLKAQNSDGVWGDTMSYTFKVLPPWYRTWWAYASYVLLFSITLWSFIKWRERTLKKEKIILEKKVAIRTHELKEEKEKVETTLLELKATQSQLIQREKMASLGELTAGIAHEIQNPLNFVNNFSEVNNELLDEMKTELATGNLRQATEIANSLKDNEEKILHHGKRADAIVKGMLQHSRVSTGQKEPIDINALADEYLRLAYHGMRAKDKSFNAEIKTDFDLSIGKVNIVPQDIGRVLLNLYNNAFYAMNEKKKFASNSYEPTILVSTKKLNGTIEIKVGDNGSGIPQNIVDKIFQPFFTTKPTGQGTGLGLSLSYDIIKAHGGEIKVGTKESGGSEFIIHLPLEENNLFK